MAIEVVANNSQEDIARHRAAENLGPAARVLAANIMRVVRGGGKPQDLAEQCEKYAAAERAYRDVWGGPPPPRLLQDALHPEKVVEMRRPWIAGTMRDEIEMAKVDMYRASLQIVASKLMDQMTQESLADSALFAGARRYRDQLARLKRERE